MRGTLIDIGCGDGRVLLSWAEMISTKYKYESVTPSISFLGIDIDPGRIEECQRKLALAKSEGKILPEMKLNFVCANALESFDLFQQATVFFLYLIPRGVKQIHPMLVQHRKRSKSVIRVATYMSKLPSETPTGRVLCHVDHQNGAAWPLYFYEL
jgi:SAM-dependent methyltransferase